MIAASLMPYLFKSEHALSGIVQLIGTKSAALLPFSYWVSLGAEMVTLLIIKNTVEKFKIRKLIKS